jgi:RNA polymerase sigma-70 factor (ECF subfamily)
MLSLTGKTMVVIGGSRGVGRRIAEAGVRNGARVLAVARQEASLRQLAREVPGVEVLSLDAADEGAASKVFDVLPPDILVLCAGAFPPAAPIHEQTWREFAVNWETDVKIAFHFCKAALSRPLPAGASVVLISSGAAVAGSPISGGYAGAKRTQMFIASYSQKESDRLGRGLQFMALAPRIMPDTDIGKHAVAGYSRYLGISEADFLESMASPPTSSDVATAVIELATNPDRSKGKAFMVSGKGLEGRRRCNMGAMTAAEPSNRELASERANQLFARLAEPFRRELKLHCYRMLGSVHEAEDAVQDAYLRAWRSFDSFDGRGSFRAWLYRIATNACLDALASRKNMRRLLPDQQAPAAAAVQMPEGAPPTEVAWLEPYPDSNLEGIADEALNPEARFASREAVRLAFVAANQQLPPRQRAVLLLRDVLGWSAGEASQLLGGSIASVNSALQRARETLARRYPDGRPEAPSQPNSAQQELLSRYARAWEEHDLDGFVALLKQEATLTMPPWRQWYAGRDAIGAFVALAWSSVGELRLAPTAANGQPAFAVYARTGVEPGWAAHALQVLDLDNEPVSTLTVFVRPLGPRLFPAFGLPLTLPDAAGAG